MSASLIYPYELEARTYKELLDFELELLYDLFLLLNDVDEVLNNILVLPDVSSVPLCCKVLHFRLEIINQLRFLCKLHIESSNLSVSINNDRHICRLLLLDQKILELFYFMKQLNNIASRVIL